MIENIIVNDLPPYVQWCPKGPNIGEGGGGYDSILKTSDYCAHFYDYSILNKYIHTLHVNNWCFHIICLYYIVVSKIVKCGSLSKFTIIKCSCLAFFPKWSFNLAWFMFIQMYEYDIYEIQDDNKLLYSFLWFWCATKHNHIF